MHPILSIRRPATLIIATAIAVGSLQAVPDPAVAITQDGTAMARLINASRAERGRRTLRISERLSSVAQKHASAMASAGRLYHNPSLAQQLSTFNWTILGENVGVGATVPTLHRAFMASDAHRRNILRRPFRRVGVGTVMAGGRLWVVVVFSD